MNCNHSYELESRTAYSNGRTIFDRWKFTCSLCNESICYDSDIDACDPVFDWVELSLPFVGYKLLNRTTYNG